MALAVPPTRHFVVLVHALPTILRARDSAAVVASQVAGMVPFDFRAGSEDTRAFDRLSASGISTQRATAYQLLL